MADYSETRLSYFDVHSEPSTVGIRWKKWLRDFELYAEEKDISTPTRKKAALLRRAGSDVQDIFFGEPEPLVPPVLADADQPVVLDVYAQTLSEMSPGSLKITLRAFQRGAQLELWQCLRMEYRISMRALHQHDFAEGVRALLIDKDNNPKWKPATLKEADDAYVETYFKKLVPEEELKLAKPCKL